jgi:hypothetical protein
LKKIKTPPLREKEAGGENAVQITGLKQLG